MKKMGFENVRYLLGSYKRLDIYEQKNQLMNLYMSFLIMP